MYVCMCVCVGVCVCVCVGVCMCMCGGVVVKKLSPLHVGKTC